MNMFKPVKAKTIEEYFKQLDPQRREIVNTIHNFIIKTVPGLRPHFAYNMLGYGSFKYKNYKNENIDWPVISFASQKNYLSIYVCALEGGKYVAEKYKNRLGKVSVGKSCIRFKKITDLNLKALAGILRIAEKNPGLKSQNKTAPNKD